MKNNFLSENLAFFEFLILPSKSIGNKLKKKMNIQEDNIQNNVKINLFLNMGLLINERL
jgi:hypothetical protein